MEHAVIALDDYGMLALFGRRPSGTAVERRAYARTLDRTPTGVPVEVAYVGDRQWTVWVPVCEKEVK